MLNKIQGEDVPGKSLEKPDSLSAMYKIARIILSELAFFGFLLEASR